MKFVTFEDIKNNTIDKFYVIHNNFIELTPESYFLELSANHKTFYPVYEFKRNFPLMNYEFVGDKKTAYEISFHAVWEDLQPSDIEDTKQLYSVFFSERDALTFFYTKLLQLRETAKRVYEVSERFVKDASTADYMKKHFEEYPEDFINVF